MKPLASTVTTCPSARSTCGRTATGSFCDCFPSIGDAGMIVNSSSMVGSTVDDGGTVVSGGWASGSSSRAST